MSAGDPAASMAELMERELGLEVGGSIALAPACPAHDHSRDRRKQRFLRRSEETMSSRVTGWFPWSTAVARTLWPASRCRTPASSPTRFWSGTSSVELSAPGIRIALVDATLPMMPSRLRPRRCRQDFLSSE